MLLDLSIAVMWATITIARTMVSMVATNLFALEFVADRVAYDLVMLAIRILSWQLEPILK